MALSAMPVAKMVTLLPTVLNASQYVMDLALMATMLAGGRGFRGGHRGGAGRFGGGGGRFGGRNPQHHFPRPGPDMRDLPIAPDLSGSHAIRPEAPAVPNPGNPSSSASPSAHLTFAQWDEDYYNNNSYDYDVFNDFALISFAAENDHEQAEPGSLVFWNEVGSQSEIADDICDQ